MNKINEILKCSDEDMIKEWATHYLLSLPKNQLEEEYLKIKELE